MRVVALVSLASCLIGFVLGRGTTSHSPVGIFSVAGSGSDKLTADDAQPANRPYRDAFRRSSVPNVHVSPAPPESSNGNAGGQTNDSRAKAIAEFRDTNLAAAASAREAVYLPVLVELGLSADQVRTILERLDGLHKGAVVAGDAMLDLSTARARYDDEIKAMLGEEGYTRYRRFESSKPFHEEAERIRAFASERGGSLDLGKVKRLAGFLEGAGLYASETWAGPYDRPPRPSAGREAMTMNEEYTARMQAGLPLLVQLESSENGLDPAEVSLVQEYFRSRLETLAEGRRWVEMTREERLAQRKAMLERAHRLR